MRVVGIDGLTAGQVFEAIGTGKHFVVYQYCFSIIYMSFKRSSAVYFVDEGEREWGPLLGCTTVSLLLGWWGIPWGPIWTIGTSFSNLGGGKDVTEEMMYALQVAPSEAAPQQVLGELKDVFA